MKQLPANLLNISNYSLQNKFMKIPKTINYLHVAYLILLLFISFFPFISSYKENLYIISVFNGFKFQSLVNIYSTWNKFNLGSFTLNFTPSILLPFEIYKLFPQYIATSFLSGLVKLISGLTIYLLLGKYTKTTSIRILASLIYMLSLYGQSIIGNTLAGGYLFYAFLPLYLYIFQTISKHNLAQYLFFYCLSLVFVVDTNFTYIFYLYLLFFLYALYVWFMNRDYSRIKYFFLFLGIFILLSQVYYLPLIAYNYIYKAHLVSTNLAAESATWKSSDSSISEIIRLMGSLDFYNAEIIQKKIVYSHPFFQIFFTNPLYILLSYIISFCAFIGLILESYISVKKQKVLNGNFYLIALLVFFFFSVGIHPTNPFYFLYATLAEKVSLFAIFRDPYKSVSILNLIYTIGFVYLFSYLTKQKKNYIISLVVIFVILALFSQSYLRGEIFSKSELINIPQYIYDFANWNRSSQNIHDAKKILLPSEPFPVLTLTKTLGKTSPIYLQILDSTAVQNTVTFTPFIRDIQRALYTPEFQKIVGFYNIPYVVNLYDNYAPLYKSTDPRKTERILQNLMQRKIVFGNGRIQVFNVASKLLNPPIYIPQRIVKVETFDPKEINLPAIFADQKDNNFAFVKENGLVTPRRVPSITINTQNNIKYNMEIKNISDSFLLVFNENYSPSWVIKQPGSLFKILPIKHIEVNGFTNGYIVDVQRLIQTVDKKYITKNRDGSINVQLELYFQPQIYFYIGLTMTLLTLLVSLSFFLYSLNKKK